jgi:ankyrin repeat protein
MNFISYTAFKNQRLEKEILSLTDDGIKKQYPEISALTHEFRQRKMAQLECAMLIERILSEDKKISLPFALLRNNLLNHCIGPEIKLITSQLGFNRDLKLSAYNDERPSFLLGHAIANNQISLVKTLFKQNLSRFFDIPKLTLCLHTAITSGYGELVKFLVNQGIRIDIRKNKETQDLINYSIVAHRQVEVTRLFKDKQKLPMNALHVAIFYGQTEIVKFLLDIGADKTKTADGISCAQLATAMGHHAILELLNDPAYTFEPLKLRSMP